MNVNNLKVSRYISKSDLPEPPYSMTLTIKGLGHENVAPADQKPEMKYTLNFFELPKPFVMNVTNGVMIAEILGDEETDNWTNGKVDMYYDPSIMMGPKKVGGIRFRPPQGSTAPQQQQQQQAQEFDDDIPK